MHLYGRTSKIGAASVGDRNNENGLILLNIGHVGKLECSKDFEDYGHFLRTI